MKYLCSKPSSFTLLASFALVTFSSNTFAQQTIVAKYQIEATVDKSKAANTGMSQSVLTGVSSLFGGSISVGSMSDTLSFGKDNYSFTSVMTPARMISLAVSGNMLRTSKGRIENNSLAMAEYVDIRFNKPPLVTLANDKKTIVFVQNKKVTARVPYRTNTQDLLSLMYAYIGRVPTGPVTINVSDGKSLKTMQLSPQAESVKVPAGSYPAIKLANRAASKTDASIELWLRASDGFPLRMRASLNERYGAVVDMKLTQAPDLVKPY